MFRVCRRVLTTKKSREQITSRSPNSVRTWVSNLCLQNGISRMNGNREQAREWFELAVELNPENTDAVHKLASLKTY